MFLHISYFMTRIDWSNRKRDTVDSSFLLFYTDQLKLLIIINNSIFFSIISVKKTNPPYLACCYYNQFGPWNNKCVKIIFRNILFHVPNWSDEQGTSYGGFSGFLCPLGGLSYYEQKLIIGPDHVIVKVQVKTKSKII